MSWRPSITWRGVGRVAFAYSMVCLFMWLMQRSLMYMPNTAIEPPQAYGLTGFEEVAVTTKDNQTVYLWHSAAMEGFPTVVHFHGNAGNLSHRRQMFMLMQQAGFGVLALDYRGFGKSSGSPTEEGLYLDARATLHYATQSLKLPERALVLYGESLGTGVAVQMATECDCAALVLQSPYTSVEQVAQETYPWLPVSLLIKDRYNSLAKVAQVHEPVLLMHGDHDTVIDIAHGKALFAALGEPKHAVYFPGKGHNDLDMRSMVNALRDFSSQRGLIPTP